MATATSNPSISATRWTNSQMLSSSSMTRRRFLSRAFGVGLAVIMRLGPLQMTEDCEGRSRRRRSMRCHGSQRGDLAAVGRHMRLGPGIEIGQGLDDQLFVDFGRPALELAGVHDLRRDESRLVAG